MVVHIFIFGKYKKSKAIFFRPVFGHNIYYCTIVLSAVCVYINQVSWCWVRVLLYAQLTGPNSFFDTKYNMDQHGPLIEQQKRVYIEGNTQKKLENEHRQSIKTYHSSVACAGSDLTNMVQMA